MATLVGTQKGRVWRKTHTVEAEVPIGNKAGYILAKPSFLISGC